MMQSETIKNNLHHRLDSLFKKIKEEIDLSFEFIIEQEKLNPKTFSYSFNDDNYNPFLRRRGKLSFRYFFLFKIKSNFSLYLRFSLDKF